MNYPICLCYHPTKVIFIDDDQNFLHATTELLNNIISFKIFNNPVDGLAFFKNSYQPSFFISRCYSGTDEDMGPDQLNFNLDMRLIHLNELKNASRFDEIAVFVIDFAMPEMDGITLSRELKKIDPLFKVILLTGEADEHLAIQAFNEGAIDQYLQKPLDSNQQLITAIIQLQNKYFYELSRSLMSKMDVALIRELQWLQNPALIDVFNKILQDNNIVEYYILDRSCNWVLIDAKGTAFWLALADEIEMKRLQDEVEPTIYTDEQLKEDEIMRAKYGITRREPKVPIEVVNGIRDRQMLPFFFTDKDMDTPIWEWKPYLQPVIKIEGNQNTFYYALIPHPSIYEWPLKNFESYQQFLAHQN